VLFVAHSLQLRWATVRLRTSPLLNLDIVDLASNIHVGGSFINCKHTVALLVVRLLYARCGWTDIGGLWDVARTCRKRKELCPSRTIVATITIISFNI
jgi:hypothetical protein